MKLFYYWFTWSGQYMLMNTQMCAAPDCCHRLISKTFRLNNYWKQERLSITFKAFI